MGEVVIFRVDREGVVFALLPFDGWDAARSHCTAYQINGGHCGASYYACIARSRPAQPREYRETLAAMRHRGYRGLLIRRRKPRCKPKGARS